MYKKQFEIRWSDVDANGHLANSAYTNFMSHARMSFFNEFGFTMKDILKNGIGPVVFYEHMYYFKESFIGAPITVTIKVSGLSEDGMLFMFEHDFYNHKGEHLAHCEMQGGWIDLKLRKLTGLPKEMLELSQKFPKSDGFKVLTKEDTRKYGVRPKPIQV
ncbi:acyl-CoA thioesterase [Winogradskyella sp. DF17]|jgi:acyl-CoA thioester hydrolase|uniref:Acyl-CoA thioesterase n=1 Tax=Winogradskyella pelagia TaxID=2819984 RepID=A0ABS3T5F9_9FLAO|nr:acyl-CoA thioesterase [Winogradskyella sp. DF17]MBO3117990.1 acyl-CoA thioesterase [Winogradskyella sp. DF17]